MTLFLDGPAGRLEAQLWKPARGAARPRAAAAFCHPHPLHGGTMRNSVVFRAARGLQQAGLAVLRFNFRGVGASAGVHDGHGGEEEDLGAALDHLEATYPGVELWAGGFSFGARTAAGRATRDTRIRRVLLIALPVIAYPIDALATLHTPGFALMAGADDFGTLAVLRERFPRLEETLELEEIPGADHFFRDRTLELQERVRRYAAAATETPA